MLPKSEFNVDQTAEIVKSQAEEIELLRNMLFDCVTTIEKIQNRCLHAIAELHLEPKNPILETYQKATLAQFGIDPLKKPEAK